MKYILTLLCLGLGFSSHAIKMTMKSGQLNNNSAFIALKASTMAKQTKQKTTRVNVKCNKFFNQKRQSNKFFNQKRQSNKFFNQKRQKIPTDDKLAIHWTIKATNQNHALSQLNLGLLYNFTNNIKDFKQAAYWYKLAAKQGNAQAQCNLGVLYHYGQGVRKDKTQSTIWYKRAALQGYKPAQLALQQL